MSRLALEWGSTELVNGIVGHAWNMVSSCLVGLVIAGLLLVQKVLSDNVQMKLSK